MPWRIRTISPRQICRGNDVTNGRLNYIKTSNTLWDCKIWCYLLKRHRSSVFRSDRTRLFSTHVSAKSGLITTNPVHSTYKHAFIKRATKEGIEAMVHLCFGCKIISPSSQSIDSVNSAVVASHATHKLGVFPIPLTRLVEIDTQVVQL